MGDEVQSWSSRQEPGLRVFHITMVIPDLGGGGAERSVLRIAKGLADRGHKVDIVIISPILAYPRDVPLMCA